MFIALILFLVLLALGAYFVSIIPGDPTIKKITNAVFIVLAVLGVLEAFGFVNLGILSSINSIIQ